MTEQEIRKEIDEEAKIKFDPKMGMFSAIPYIRNLQDQLISARMKIENAKAVIQHAVDVEEKVQGWGHRTKIECFKKVLKDL